MKLTHVLVALFIVVLALAAHSAWGADGPRISLGHTMINSHDTYGEFGYEYRAWEVAAARIGERPDPADVFSLSRLIRPDWQILGATNYYRLGFAYVDDSPLIGDTNYRLGVGLEWSLFQLEYFHISSAGIHDPNTGIDGIQLRLIIPLQ